MLEGSGGPSGGEAAGASKFQSAGTGSSASAGGSVYMGSFSGSGFVSPYAPTGSTGQTLASGNKNALSSDNYLSKNDAYGYFNNFSGKQLRDFIATGQVAGLLGDNDGFIEGQKLWKKLVDASAGLTAAGRKVAPLDILSSYLGKGPLGAAGSGQAGASLWQVQYRSGRKFLVNTQTGQVKYQGPKFETTYQKSIDMTDPTTAKALATSVFQQLLHRDPGNGELASYGDALRTAEQQSPVVANTTTEYDPNTGEAVGSTTNTTGGLTADAKQYLETQKVKKSKEFGVVQAATTYENALENAIFNNPFGS
jgi:hypothetical protein